MNPKNKERLWPRSMMFARRSFNPASRKKKSAQASIPRKANESNLAEDATVCFVVHRFQLRGVNMELLAQRLDRYRYLTTEQVNAAARKPLALNNVKVHGG